MVVGIWPVVLGFGVMVGAGGKITSGLAEDEGHMGELVASFHALVGRPPGSLWTPSTAFRAYL